MLPVGSVSILFMLWQSGPASRTDVAATRRIVARVVDTGGVPIAGALAGMGDDRTIAVDDVTARPAARSGSDGLLVLEVPRTMPADPRSEGPVLLVSAPGRATAWLAVAPAIEARPAPLDLGVVTLPAGRTLGGVVVATDGKPIAGARVLARDALTPIPWRNACWASATRTRSNGMFLLPGVVDGPLHLRVEAEGFARRVLRPVTGRDALRVELVPTGFVNGMVEGPQRDPLVGAMVRLRYEWSEESPAYPVARDGTFRVSVPFAGRFAVVAESGWFAGVGISEVLDGPAQDVRVPLAGEGQWLRVHARDAATGREVKDFRGCVQPMYPTDRSVSVSGGVARMNASTLLRMMHMGVPRASADGVLRLAAPEGQGPMRMRSALVLAADGFRTAVVDMPDPVAPAELAVDLHAGPAITGQVVAPDGRPAAGAVVSWRPQALDDQPAAAAVVADDAGHFALTGPWPDAFVLSATDADGRTSRDLDVEVVLGAAPPAVKLATRSPVTIHGTASGAPPGARLRIVARAAWERTERERTQRGVAGLAAEPGFAPVAADGAFTLAAVPGQAQVVALWVPSPQPQGPALVTQAARLDQVDPAVPLQLDLRRHVPGRIHARVKRPSPWLARMALTSAETTRGSGPNPNEWLPHRRWCTATRDCFDLTVPPGRHHLQVVDLGTGLPLWSRKDVEVAPGGDIELEVALTVVELEVAVRGPDGQPGAAEWLGVRTGKWAQDDSGFGSWRDDGYLFPVTIGADLLGRPEPLHLLVPAGPVRLLVNAGMERLGRNSKGGTCTRLASELLDVAEEPALRRVTLDLAASRPVRVQ